MSLFFALVVLNILIFIHEFGHFLIAKRSGVEVERFSLGLGKEVLSVKRGETRYSLCLLPFGGYVKMAGENIGELQHRTGEFLTQPVGKRFWIIAAGSIFNYLFGFLLFFLIFVLGSSHFAPCVGRVKEGFPAQGILRKGDEVVAVNGRKVRSWEEMARVIQRSRGRVELIIEREGERKKVSILPRIEQGRKMIGIFPSGEIVKISYGPLSSLYLAGRKTLELTILTYTGLWNLLRGKVSWKALTGPVGIVYLTGKVAERGISSLFQFLAILSISLALFNLLPFPVLDGGHLLFLGLEKVRKKPLSERTQQIVQDIGVIILFLLFIGVTWGDLLKISFWKTAP
ncbi:MAG: RIP metalloprotease RseP [Candidatus Omnitrophota bacterium]|nr:MAG: RIP metalloprotease RseP [Candidatus Omnitrophota bacterium]